MLIVSELYDQGDGHGIGRDFSVDYNGELNGDGDGDSSIWACGTGDGVGGIGGHYDLFEDWYFDDILLGDTDFDTGTIVSDY